MGKLFLNIKSTVLIISNKVKTLISWVTAIGAATMAAFNNKLVHDAFYEFNFFKFIEKNLGTFIVIAFIILILLIIFIFFYTLYNVYSGKFSTTIFKDRKVNILYGNVHENFLYTINSYNFKKNPSEYIFIYPISMNGDQNRTWPSSTSHELISFLDRSYNLLLYEEFKPSNQLKKSIDNFILNKKNNAKKPLTNIIENIDVKYTKEIPNFKELYPLDFGDIIESNVVLYDLDNNKFILNFLLVANYIDSYEMIYTAAHNDIIISNCINYVASLNHYKKLVMYLFGIRDYDMHVLNVFASVINSFASTFTKYNKNDKSLSLEELTISCQKKDVEDWNVSLGQLEAYANIASRYYRINEK